MAKEPPRPVDLMREALPTLEDAIAFFDLVAARFGGRAIVQTSNEAKNRAMYVRTGGDGIFIFPWPLLTLSIADRPEGGLPDEDQVIDAPAWAPGEPIDLLAGGLHPVPATVSLCDGALKISVHYRWSGRWKDGSEPGELDAFADLIPALLKGTGSRLELLAEYAISMDLGRHGPARVILPRPTPGGVEGAWNVGKSAIRGAMASRRSPPGSFWAVADGYVGTAITFGTSRDDALAKWRLEVEKVRPRPPPPPDPSSLPSPDADDWAQPDWRPDAQGVSGLRFVPGSGWGAPPFDSSPSAVPAAVVRVAAPPATKPPQGEWTRWIGDRGETIFAVRLAARTGYTLVGESLLAHFDLSTIDAQLDALDDANPGLSRGEGLPEDPRSAPRTEATVYYRCMDLGTGLPIEPRAESSWIDAGFDARGFEANRMRSYIVRVRRIA